MGHFKSRLFSLWLRPYPLLPPMHERRLFGLVGAIDLPTTQAPVTSWSFCAYFVFLSPWRYKRSHLCKNILAFLRQWAAVFLTFTNTVLFFACCNKSRLFKDTRRNTFYFLLALVVSCIYYLLCCYRELLPPSLLQVYKDSFLFR